MTTVEANGVTLGVEHFGDAAAPLVLLAGGIEVMKSTSRSCIEVPPWGRGGRYERRLTPHE